jgi:NAD(P)-dependent dehydrogenase (short-subunit alcohol dehydrogenase family)
MQVQLDGQVALFTGAVSPITVTVARWLGNQGVRLVFAGPGVNCDPLLDPLVYQFRRDILCLECPITEASAVHELVDSVEASCGRVDMLFHTLGRRRRAEAIDAFSLAAGGTGALMNTQDGAPLSSALACTSSAIRHMARKAHGHVIHLVTPGEVGAIEVERLILDQIRDVLSQEVAGSDIRLSAIYFDGAATMQLCHGFADRPESRLMDDFTSRLVEEDGWMGRIMVEEGVGDMVRLVCGQQGATGQPRMELIDFHGGLRPTMERHAIQ